ncbi:MAG: 16S rRNA (cytosine(967)-C(5))-methyltransferase RsmB [Halioglobus sp.]|nr:16S rRNA (cytosine(967)-C(5))-methyltransferase RsmB [Halioglobus sp.]
MALDIRAAAASVIGDVLGGLSLNQALPPRLDKVSERDRGLLQQLCYGTIRQAPRLQALLAQMLAKPLRDKDRDIQGLLLCGLYQLDSTRVPDHAAVAATVDATRALKKHWAKGMANAILRRYLREREQLAQALDAAARDCHPHWLHRKIMSQWPAQGADIIAANNQQPPMTLRTNSRRITREAGLAALQDKDIEAAAGKLSAQALQLAQPMDVWDIPGFAAGHMSVQDEAAQMAALLLAARAGERVLDACAAPGGKTCHILELQPALSELVAMDIDDTRLQRVSENLARLDLKATLLAGDAAQPPPQLVAESFDRILVDAPCSASGVIRRHPDVKLLRRDSDIAQLAEQQLGILQGLWPLLKAGGTLLYATCSIFDEENSQVVRRFLEEHSDADLADTELAWGEPVAAGRQLLPAVNGPDGLFYARLNKAG